MTTIELWQQYQPRFEYWQQWAEKELGSIPICYYWWRSRFNDDHPWYDHAGFNKQNFDLRGSFKPLWVYYMAPELGIDLGPVQLRLL